MSLLARRKAAKRLHTARDPRAGEKSGASGGASPVGRDPGFQLYLTTNFDPLLAQALELIRGQSEAITQTFAFHPRKPVDLIPR
jgi:hypothetical protein